MCWGGGSAVLGRREGVEDNIGGELDLNVSLGSGKHVAEALICYAIEQGA
jgi:hypothetical protein